MQRRRRVRRDDASVDERERARANTPEAVLEAVLQQLETDPDGHTRPGSGEGDAGAGSRSPTRCARSCAPTRM